VFEIINAGAKFRRRIVTVFDTMSLNRSRSREVSEDLQAVCETGGNFVQGCRKAS
jgi:hypothetical protein